MVAPLGDPKHWPAEAWYGLLGALAWATVTAAVGVVRDRFDPAWLTFAPTLVEWILVTVGLLSIASVTMQLAAVRRASAAPAMVAAELSRVIDQAAADGKFRLRPRRLEHQTGGWSNDTIRIFATHALCPIPWEAFRDEFRSQRAPGGLSLAGAWAPSGVPVIVTVTVTSLTQHRILRNVRLEVEEGAVRAVVKGALPNSSIESVTVVTPDQAEDAPQKVTFEFGNLDYDSPAVLDLITESNSPLPEPNDFRWYLYEDQTELGSGRLRGISGAG